MTHPNDPVRESYKFDWILRSLPEIFAFIDVLSDSQNLGYDAEKAIVKEKIEGRYAQKKSIVSRNPIPVAQKLYAKTPSYFECWYYQKRACQSRISALMMDIRKKSKYEHSKNRKSK